MNNIGRRIYFRDGWISPFHETIIIGEGYNWIVFQESDKSPEFQDFDDSKEKQKWIEEKAKKPAESD